MSLDWYTPDVICQSLGLGVFEGPALLKSDRSLRLLLKPSFYPEACITVSTDGELTTLDVVGFVHFQLFAQHGSARKIATCRCTREINKDHAEKFWTSINSCLLYWQVNAQTTNSLVLDGMGCSALFKQSATASTFEQNASGPGLVRDLVIHAIQLCWQHVHDRECCQLMGNCSKYVALQLPEKQTHPSKIRKDIAIFGSSEDQDDLQNLMNGNL
jgi:hypothetical protein